MGCRQYHSAVAGVFESLSYSSGPGSPYLANTNYAVCFRPRSGFCGLRLTSAAPGAFIMNSNIGDQVSCDWWRAGHVTAGWRMRRTWARARSVTTTRRTPTTTTCRCWAAGPCSPTPPPGWRTPSTAAARQTPPSPPSTVTTQHVSYPAYNLTTYHWQPATAPWWSGSRQTRESSSPMVS